MGTVTVSRKQRLRTLEKEIRSGMEEFYYTGMKLKEIRDDHLYKEDGFQAWEKYCKERWELGKSQVYSLIKASEYREKISDSSSAGHTWSHRAVTELTRIPDKRQAVRVAKQVIQEVEKSEKAAKQDKTLKPIKLSSSTVRKAVDKDLGVKRGQEKKQPKVEPTFDQYLLAETGNLLGLVKILKGVSEDSWKLLDEAKPQSIKHLITACDSLAEFLRKVVR